MKHPGTPRRPHPDPEILALADSGEPDCGLQFRPGICTMKHAAAKRKEAEGKQHGPCAYCPLILKHLGRDVTKSADSDAPTCTTCGNALTKNGFCHSCRSTAQRVGEAEKRQMCKTCGKCRAKDGFEHCSYCLKRYGRTKFKEKLEESKTMTTTESKPAKPIKKRPATCKQCGKPCTFNESGLCRPCSAARNARKAREAKPLSKPEKSTPEPKIEQKPEPQRCPKCGKKLTKNGFCYACAAHEREAKKSKKTAPKTGAKKLPTMPASRLCREQNIQNCHDCDDLTCGDNLRMPAGDTIHAGSTPDDRFGELAPTMTPGLVSYKQPESIYRRALRHYGDHSQIMKTAEEAAELAAAITRYMSPKSWGSTNPLIAMTEELADVEIMCQQMRLIFGNQPIDAAKKMKLERLEKRLNDED